MSSSSSLSLGIPVIVEIQWMGFYQLICQREEMGIDVDSSGGDY